MKVLLSCTLDTAFGTYVCRLHDLSRGGACLDCEVKLTLGQKITFRRGTLAVEAVVAWVGRSRFGIRFLTPIRATELLVQMNQSRQVVAKGSEALRAVPVGPRPNSVSAGARPLSPST